jgi:hypothetical protein
MKINELTIGEAQEIIAIFNHPTSETHPYRIGANYFIRTVTYHYTGRLVAVGPQELVLENAAWIADDGRFTDALTSCQFNEVEMFPAGKRVVLGRGSLIDAVEINSLPTSQK